MKRSETKTNAISDSVCDVYGIYNYNFKIKDLCDFMIYLQIWGNRKENKWKKLKLSYTIKLIGIVVL